MAPQVPFAPNAHNHPMAIDIGTSIPDLVGTTGDDRRLSLGSLRGQWLVLYFYPRDSTPGCTTEAQEFRDLYRRFRERDAQVIGVSRDSPRSHANFAAKQALPFPLVADADESWCRAFDVIHEKILYGKRHLGILRSTFLFDRAGTLVQAWRAVKVAGHAQAVLDAIPAP